MRRLIGILIALALPMVVVGVAALVTYRPGMPEMAQNTLERYLSRVRQLGRPASVLETRVARYPRAFTAALTGPTFGDGIYYSVSFAPLDYPTPATIGVVAGILATNSGALTPVGNLNGQRPLPYPPEQIWCVRLQPEGAAAGAPEVVLLALHQDLYNASWAVHELPPGTAAQTLALVGCASR